MKEKKLLKMTLLQLLRLRHQYVVDFLNFVNKSDPEECQLFGNKSIMYICGYVMDKRVSKSEERLNLGGRDLNVWRT